MQTLAKLKSIIISTGSPAENNIESIDWEKWESNIGLQLPDDYKAFISYYGTGRLANLVWILNPFSQVERFNMLAFLATKKKAFQFVEEESGKKYPYSLFLDGRGLLPFAFTDNGDTIYWHIMDSGFKSWSIVVIDGRSMDTEKHETGFSDFLYNALNHELQSSILSPDDFIGKNFDPLPTSFLKER